MANNDDLLKKIIAHAKEYGFVFQSSEIYDGLSAVYDYGQMGVELKNNIKQYWWKAMVQYHENIVKTIIQTEEKEKLNFSKHLVQYVSCVRPVVFKTMQQ